MKRRFSKSAPFLKPAPTAHGRHNDHRADGANDRPRDSQCDRHGEPLRARIPGRVRDPLRDRCNDAAACIPEDWSLTQRSRVRPHGRHADDVDDHRADSPHVPRERLPCGRSSDRADACDSRVEDDCKCS